MSKPLVYNYATAEANDVGDKRKVLEEAYRKTRAYELFDPIKIEKEEIMDLPEVETIIYNGDEYVLQKKGEWIDRRVKDEPCYILPWELYECSLCGQTTSGDDFTYCPNCGAYMGGDE